MNDEEKTLKEMYIDLFVEKFDRLFAKKHSLELTSRNINPAYSSDFKDNYADCWTTYTIKNKGTCLDVDVETTIIEKIGNHNKVFNVYINKIVTLNKPFFVIQNYKDGDPEVRTEIKGLSFESISYGELDKTIPKVDISYILTLDDFLKEINDDT